MKRSDFIKHLKKHKCILHREGGNHSIYKNQSNQRQSAVGRHRELSNLLCKKICKQLDIPTIK
ncbi:MAG: type II toxin-antitoxin system HicA family toxin [Flavobacteriales bacterium]|nr:MAG: type II toxin-antitoxin system HicA family toxin [Flavobacteriales bacterium]